MTAFVLFLLVGFALLIAVVAERELSFRRQNAVVQIPLRDQVRLEWDRFFRVGRTLLIPRHAERAARFRAWAAVEINDDALRTWLTALPERDLIRLTRQIRRFCKELNINFEWLLNGEIDHEPEMREKIYEIVVDFCRSRRQVSRSQPTTSRPQ